VLVLLVFVVEAWAIQALLATSVSRRLKRRWIAAIVLLPVVGFVLWLRRGPRQRIRDSIHTGLRQ
jgi:hypothetical protein